MKKISLFIICLLLPIFVYAGECQNSNGSFKSGNVSVNMTSAKMKVGETKTFTISAPCAAGKVTITSSNTNIVIVSSSKEFLDNSTINVKMTAKGSGTANINIVFSDMADYTSRILSGNKNISVTVSGSSSTTVPSSQTPSTPDSPSEQNPSETSKPIEVVVPEKADESMTINRFTIEGTDFKFHPNVLEYTIDVPEGLTHLNVNATSDDSSVIGSGKVNITNKNQIFVTFKKGSISRTYIININRIQDDLVTEPEVKKGIPPLLYVIIVIGIIATILFVISIINNRKNQNGNI